MECSPNGRNAARAPICVTKNIRSYPTWDINGERYTGVLKPEDLARYSRFTGTPASVNSQTGTQ